MGVKVSETTAEIKMVALNVIGEFAKKAAHHVAHEQQGDQYRDQGNGQRQDGEPDLFRALESSRHRRFSRFDVARDVFDHYDGVVHHEAGGDGQSHEGEVVEAEAEQIHYAEGPHQRQGNRDAGDHGGGQCAQKQEDHHNDQRNGEEELELDIVNRSANSSGAIGQHGHVHGRGQGGAELRKQLRYTVHHGDDVGARLPLDVQNHGRHQVHPGGLSHILRAVHYIGDVGKNHGRAVAISNHQRAVIGAGK